MDNRENERKDSNQADSELSSTTQFSYKEAKVNVRKIRRLGRIKKTGFAFLAFASFLYLCLYFSLPCFQVENRQVVGLLLGVLPIGFCVISTNLSIFSKPLIFLYFPGLSFDLYRF